MKLTQRAVERLPAPDLSGKPKIHWDDELRGFGVLVSGVTATKSFIVQHDLPGGKSRRVTIARVGMLPLPGARKQAIRALLEMQAGKDPKAGRKTGRRGAPTLRKALDAYIVGSPKLRPASVRNYRGAVARWLAAWADRPLSEIGRDMVQARYAELVEQSGAAAGNMAMAVLRAIWNHAADADPALPPNPVRLGKQWREIPRRTRKVDFSAMPAFWSALQAAPNSVQRDYVTLLLFTGLRKLEAASLRWSDIDFGAGTLTIPAERTKNGVAFVLPMSDFVADLLARRRALGDLGGFVFPAASRSGHLSDIGGAFAGIERACGIRVSCHDLRRTYATIAARIVSGYTLKRLLNHSSRSDVTAGYVQIGADELRGDVERIAARITELRAGPITVS